MTDTAFYDELAVALGTTLWFFVCIIPPEALARYRSS
jgi:hypothetical protein